MWPKIVFHSIVRVMVLAIAKIKSIMMKSKREVQAEKEHTTEHANKVSCLMVSLDMLKSMCACAL